MENLKRIPVFIDDLNNLRVSPDAMRVYINLVSRRNAENGKAWPSILQIGEDCFSCCYESPKVNTLRSRARRAILELEDKSLIYHETIKLNNKEFGHNIYSFKEVEIKKKLSTKQVTSTQNKKTTIGNYQPNSPNLHPFLRSQSKHLPSDLSHLPSQPGHNKETKRNKLKEKSFKERVTTEAQQQRNDWIKKVKPSSLSTKEISSQEKEEGQEILNHFEETCNIKIKKSFLDYEIENITSLKRSFPDIEVEDCKHAIEVANKHWTGDFKNNCIPRIIFKKERFRELIQIPRPAKKITIEEPDPTIVYLSKDEVKDKIKQNLSGILSELKEESIQKFELFLAEQASEEEVLYDPLYSESYVYALSLKEKEKSKKNEIFLQGLKVSTYEEYKTLRNLNSLKILETNHLKKLNPEFEKSLKSEEKEKKKQARSNALKLAVSALR